MITFLHGTLVEKQPMRAVLDVGGVGYEILIPLSSYDRLPGTGERCRVLTHDYIREDTHQLYGFMTEAERRMFELLVATNGIGPKLAISALSGLSVRDIKVAVVEGDVKRLTSISGVGKKMAERMIVELRHRITDAEALEAVAGSGDDEGSTLMRDAILALIALGYKQNEARAMVKQATNSNPKLTTVEDVIKHSLAR